MSTFSEKLRILRKNKEWTQAQLADALSVSESTVQKWEVDKNAPPVSEIKRLRRFSISPSQPWLMMPLPYQSSISLRASQLKISVRAMRCLIPPAQGLRCQSDEER